MLQVMISVITAISVIGVAAGVMALVVAMAITNGLRDTLQTNLLGATAHVSILEKEMAEAARVKLVPAQMQRETLDAEPSLNAQRAKVTAAEEAACDINRVIDVGVDGLRRLIAADRASGRLAR